jgi:hypothetical protein
MRLILFAVVAGGGMAAVTMPSPIALPHWAWVFEVGTFGRGTVTVTAD